MKFTHNKYRAIKTTLDGITFDSKKEANRYAILKLREKTGSISHLELQPQFKVEINGRKICTYRADFQYIDKNVKGVDGQFGAMVVEDVKGVKTPVYRLKKKLVEAYFPGTIITEV